MIGVENLEASEICGLLYGLGILKYTDESGITPDMLASIRQEIGDLCSLDLLLALSGLEKLNVRTMTLFNAAALLSLSSPICHV